MQQRAFPLWELRRMWVRAQPDAHALDTVKREGDAYTNLKDLLAFAIDKRCCVWMGDFAQGFIQGQIRECEMEHHD